MWLEHTCVGINRILAATEWESERYLVRRLWDGRNVAVSGDRANSNHRAKSALARRSRVAKSAVGVRIDRPDSRMLSPYWEERLYLEALDGDKLSEARLMDWLDRKGIPSRT